jgi:hypothetical protein
MNLVTGLKPMSLQQPLASAAHEAQSGFGDTPGGKALGFLTKTASNVAGHVEKANANVLGGVQQIGEGALHGDLGEIGKGAFKTGKGGVAAAGMSTPAGVARMVGGEALKTGAQAAIGHEPSAPAA